MLCTGKLGCWMWGCGNRPAYSNVESAWLSLPFSHGGGFRREIESPWLGSLSRVAISFICFVHINGVLPKPGLLQ